VVFGRHAGAGAGVKIGARKIHELCDRVREAQGASFDIRRFHDHLLDFGSMPMGVLKLLATTRPLASDVAGRFPLDRSKQFAPHRCQLLSRLPDRRHPNVGFAGAPRNVKVMPVAANDDVTNDVRCVELRTSNFELAETDGKTH